ARLVPQPLKFPTDPNFIIRPGSRYRNDACRSDGAERESNADVDEKEHPKHGPHPQSLPSTLLSHSASTHLPRSIERVTRIRCRPLWRFSAAAKFLSNPAAC